MYVVMMLLGCLSLVVFLLGYDSRQAWESKEEWPKWERGHVYGVHEHRKMEMGNQME